MTIGDLISAILNTKTVVIVEEAERRSIERTRQHPLNEFLKTAETNNINDNISN